MHGNYIKYSCFRIFSNVFAWCLAFVPLPQIAMISPGLSSCEHSLNTLRYADRVKELAANGPSENKTSPEQDRGSPNAQDIGLDDSDLAQLRSLNVSISEALHFAHSISNLNTHNICLLHPKLTIISIVFFFDFSGR